MPTEMWTYLILVHTPSGLEMSVSLIPLNSIYSICVVTIQDAKVRISDAHLLDIPGSIPLHE
jgi:hypothetical protein